MFHRFTAWPYSHFPGIKILTQVFYAVDRARTAVNISMISMLLNIALCVALMFPMNFLGLALATSIAGIIQFFMLYHYVEKYVGDIKTKELIVFSVKDNFYLGRLWARSSCCWQII